MTKLVNKSAHAHIDALRAAAAQLVLALDAHTAARCRYDLARDAMEDEKRRLLLATIPGLPERPTCEQRDAALHCALESHGRALRAARERLRETENDVEKAKTHERTERELLRAVTGGGGE